MRIKQATYLMLITFIFLGFSVMTIPDIDADNIKIEVLNTTNNRYIAGDSIVLKFKTESAVKTHLFINSSYGKTVIDSEKKDVFHSFHIPTFLAIKKGIIKYRLFFENEELLQGTIVVEAAQKIKEPLESYLGPTSIIAGGNDFGMFTIIPSDIFDNPLEDSTTVRITHQFLEQKGEKLLYTKDFVVWENIFSKPKSGRILVSSNINKTASKEFTLDVFPSTAQNFKLFTSRKHEYADGNQIVSFFTSEIKDKHGNTVSDGRIVEFSIETDDQQKLRTIGTTINGIAYGYLIHPTKATNWTVKAFIPGMAESNQLTLSFKAAVKEYPIIFSESNRKVRIGPILSFMDQIIPDGAKISLEIYENEKVIEKLHQFSSEGFVNFNLSEDVYPKGEYTIKISGMGFVKTYEQIELQ